MILLVENHPIETNTNTAMNKPKLGRLKKAGLRDAWASESGDFTPWLAQAENLELLGEAIGIGLECTAQEKGVGPFRADLLCKDTATQHWVLIENQLERTDHSHLGQLLTYAAGLEAVTIVWVAEQFTEEHRAALDWLNEHTAEKINFFGLEIELWQIDDSPPAPKFNVVCKPNEWTRYISEAAKSIDPDELGGRPQIQYQYWSEFLVVLRARTKVEESRSPQARAWMTFPVGRSGFRLWTEIYLGENAIGVGLNISKSGGDHFRTLREMSQKLEQELGFPLEWDEKAGRDQNYVGIYHECDPNDRKDWPEQHIWLAEKLARLQRVLSGHLRRLPAIDDSDIEAS